MEINYPIPQELSSNICCGANYRYVPEYGTVKLSKALKNESQTGIWSLMDSQLPEGRRSNLTPGMKFMMAAGVVIIGGLAAYMLIKQFRKRR